jgi:hypothetical protein
MKNLQIGSKIVILAVICLLSQQKVIKKAAQVTPKAILPLI